MKNLLVALSLTAALALSGCGADCESLCEDMKACSTATEDIKAQDCAKTCADAETANETMGCTSQYDDVVSCSAGQDDICVYNEEACKTESAAYVSCVIAFCLSNPDSDACK